MIQKLLIVLASKFLIVSVHGTFLYRRWENYFNTFLHRW